MIDLGLSADTWVGIMVTILAIGAIGLLAVMRR